MPVTIRHAARVLLVDAKDRLLLLCGHDPARPEDGAWWISVGGGIDPHETEREAAARELYEETGLRCDPADLGVPVFSNIAKFCFAGEDVEQHQTFFLLRIAAHTVDTAGLEEREAGYLTGHRWWTSDELRATTERVYPSELADLLDRLR